MKKIAFCLIFCSIVLIFCGCAGNTETAANSVTFNSTDITLNAEFSSVSEALGTPINTTESKSCLYDGYDKTYEYADLTIITYPLNGKELISSVTFTSENVTHTLPAGIGGSVDALNEAYKDKNPNVSDTVFIVEDTFGIAYYTENKTITEIEIYNLQ